MSEDVEDVPRDWVDDRQPVDLILQQGVDGIKQTEKKRLVIELGAVREIIKVIGSAFLLNTDTKVLWNWKQKYFSKSQFHLHSGVMLISLFVEYSR